MSCVAPQVLYYMHYHLLPVLSQPWCIISSCLLSKILVRDTLTFPTCRRKCISVLPLRIGKSRLGPQ